MKINDKKIICSTKEIASELGVAQKYISELVNDHSMPKVKHNQFDLVEVLRWHRDYKLAEKDREISKLKEDDPQKDLARKNAVLKQIQIEEAEGQIVRKDEIRPAILVLFKVVIQMLDGMSAKLSPKLKSINNIAEIKKIIQTEIDLLKKQISETNFISIKAESE